MVELVDLSGYVEEDQPIYPGNQDTRHWYTKTHEQVAKRNRFDVGRETEAIALGLKAHRSGSPEEHPMGAALLVDEHGPTHIDALSHLDPTNDQTIDDMALDWFFGDAVGVDLSEVGNGYISIDMIKGALTDATQELKPDDTILLYTGHRERYYSTDEPESKHHYIHSAPGLDENAAYWLADKGMKNIGIDTPSIDHSDALTTKEYPAHVMCAEHDIINMENMANLDRVAGKRFTICAFPLKIRGGTGSPIRPVAVID